MRRFITVSLVGLLILLVGGSGTSAPTGIIATERVIISNQTWLAHKVIRQGREEHLFQGPGGVVLTSAEMAAWFPEPVIEAELMERLKHLAPEAPVRIIVMLRRQPVPEISEQVDRILQPRVDALRSQAEEALSVMRNARGRVAAEGTQRLRQMAGQWKVLRRARNHQILQQAGIRNRPQQDELIGYIQSLGGRAHGGYRMVNMVAAVVPARAVSALAASPLVAHIGEDQLVRMGLDNSVLSIGSSAFWSAGFTGGTWDVGILDSGMDATHPAFAGKAFVHQVFHTTGATDPNYADSPTNPDDLQGHGTHVGGIVMSQGAPECPGCQGVARGLDTTFNLKAGWRATDGGAWMYWSDMYSAVDWAGAYPAVYNLSYGSSTWYDYSSASWFVDAAVQWFGSDFALAAGNTGPSNVRFTTPGVACNAVTVASMNDQNTMDRLDDRISSFSSRGPTAKGRKKPDLTAPGQTILAPRHSWETLSDFVNFSGTSMAAPHVAGALLLLWDAGLWTYPPHARKAVLINTADAWSDRGTPTDSTDDGPVPGSLWNRTYGWGYINLTRAFANRHDVFTASIPSTDPWDSFFVVGNISVNDKATLVWHQRSNYGGATPPSSVWWLTDLDLWMFRESNNAILITSTSAVDSVEQVAAPETSRVVIKTDVWGGISGAATEAFSLATPSGFEAAVLGPGVRLGHTPPVVCPNSAFTARARLRHWGNIHSHTNTITLTVPAGFTLTGGGNPATFSRIDAGTHAEASWSITAPAGGTGAFLGSLMVGWTYEELFSRSHAFNITVHGPKFADVPCEFAFYPWIERVTDTGVMETCGSGNFCPTGPVTRADMAVFIIRAMGETPAPCTGYFADVPIGSYGCGHIERLVQLGVVAGCSAGPPRLYCPVGLVNRGQMAVFIVKARELADARWAPWPRATATFADVPTTHPFHRFVERLVLEQVTDGCGGGNYCPTTTINRGQMAVFIARAFPTQW